MMLCKSDFGYFLISDETIAETHNLDKRRSDVKQFGKDIQVILATEYKLSGKVEITPDFII